MHNAIPYFNRLESFIDEENPSQIANLLSLNHSHVETLIDQKIWQLQNQQFRTTLDSPWNEIASLHLKTIAHVDNGEYGKAYETQKELVQTFQRGMSSMASWCLPALYVINNDLTLVASAADLESVATQSQRTNLEDAVNVIRKSFTYCITDRTSLSQSKKYGTYYMVGILFRVYLKLNKHNLCHNIIRAVTAADLPPLEDFPKSHRVTYRYYLGRVYFLDEDYAKAETELTAAFRECTNSSRKNKKLILQYLLPLKLMRGVLPTKALLDQYPETKEVYGTLVDSIKKGDIKSFRDTLDASGSLLIKQGVFSAIEQAEKIANRELFRKVYLALGSNSRIRIEAFHCALRFQGFNDDIHDVEWMVCNLIAEGYIRGYVSHEKKTIVLSKENPFPRPSGVRQS